MFAQPDKGRTLVEIIRRMRMNVIAGANTGIEIEKGSYGKIYRMTLEAMKVGLLSQGIEAQTKVEAHLEELKRLEEEETTMIV